MRIEVTNVLVMIGPTEISIKTNDQKVRFSNLGCWQKVEAH